MVDEAGEIRVLEVDPLQQLVAAIDEPAGRARPAHSSAASANSAICATLGCDGAASPRCAKALGVSSRPRGVRCTKPCWIR